MRTRKSIIFLLSFACVAATLTIPDGKGRAADGSTQWDGVWEGRNAQVSLRLEISGGQVTASAVANRAFNYQGTVSESGEVTAVSAVATAVYASTISGQLPNVTIDSTDWTYKLRLTRDSSQTTGQPETQIPAGNTAASAPVSDVAQWNGTWRGDAASGNVVLDIADGIVNGTVVLAHGTARVAGKVKADGRITATGKPRGNQFSYIVFYVLGQMPEVRVESNNRTIIMTLTR